MVHDRHGHSGFFSNEVELGAKAATWTLFVSKLLGHRVDGQKITWMQVFMPVILYYVGLTVFVVGGLFLCFVVVILAMWGNGTITTYQLLN
jgi:hypothetical protein